MRKINDMIKKGRYWYRKFYDYLAMFHSVQNRVGHYYWLTELFNLNGKISRRYIEVYKRQKNGNSQFGIFIDIDGSWSPENFSKVEYLINKQGKIYLTKIACESISDGFEVRL